MAPVNASGVPLTDEQVQRIARIRELGQLLHAEITAIGQSNHDAMPPMYCAETADKVAALDRSNGYLFEARRRLQEGLMWLNKAVANPAEF